MQRSVISDERRCMVCGKTKDLHRHHIFFGAGYRTSSEVFGAWCYLCPEHHNMSDDGVHFNRNLDIRLKKMAQERFEKDRGWSRERFTGVFGKSYAEIEEERDLLVEIMEANL